MSLNRYAKRRDKNEPEIIEALKKIGASVTRLDTPFDLLVGYKGQDYKIEVKTKTGKLTPAQQIYIKEQKGNQLFVVTTPEEAIKVISLEAGMGNISDKGKN